MQTFYHDTNSSLKILCPKGWSFWPVIDELKITHFSPRTRSRWNCIHNSDVIMVATASQITRLAIVYSTIFWRADERKHQSSVSLVYVRGIHRSPENSPHKWPLTRKMFPFDDVIMSLCVGPLCQPRGRRYSIHGAAMQQIESWANTGTLFTKR